MTDTLKPEEPQEPPPSIGDGDKSQQQFDLCKLRAEEYERSFYSLRTVEWQVALQSYVGYGAITAGFTALNDPSKGLHASNAEALLCIVGLIVLLAVAIFWQWQIQQRMHLARKLQNRYLTLLHKRTCVPDLQKEEKEPDYQNWWAFAPWALTNVIAVVALIYYIAGAIRWC